MTLSPEAEAFLKRQERRPFISNRSSIEQALQKANVPLFEPVIQFQLNYGGYTIYAGYEPQVYGIIHPTTRSDFVPLSIEAEEDDDEGIWVIRCVDTLYQMNYHIDQFGRYYEDGEIIASSMDQYLEQFVFLNEIFSQEGWRSGYLRLLKTEAVMNRIAQLGLELSPTASDQYSSFWYSHVLLVHTTKELITAWYREDDGKRLSSELAKLSDRQRKF